MEAPTSLRDPVHLLRPSVEYRYAKTRLIDSQKKGGAAQKTSLSGADTKTSTPPFSHRVKDLGLHELRPHKSSHAALLRRGDTEAHPPHRTEPEIAGSFRFIRTQGHNKGPFLLRFTSYGGQVGRDWGER